MPTPRAAVPRSVHMFFSSEPPKTIDSWTHPDTVPRLTGPRCEGVTPPSRPRRCPTLARTEQAQGTRAAQMDR